MLLHYNSIYIIYKIMSYEIELLPTKWNNVVHRDDRDDSSTRTVINSSRPMECFVFRTRLRRPRDNNTEFPPCSITLYNNYHRVWSLWNLRNRSRRHRVYVFILLSQPFVNNVIILWLLWAHGFYSLYYGQWVSGSRTRSVCTNRCTATTTEGRGNR